jgi:hypothetical protein
MFEKFAEASAASEGDPSAAQTSAKEVATTTGRASVEEWHFLSVDVARSVVAGFGQVPPP